MQVNSRMRPLQGLPPLRLACTAPSTLQAQRLSQWALRVQHWL